MQNYMQLHKQISTNVKHPPCNITSGHILTTDPIFETAGVVFRIREEPTQPLIIDAEDGEIDDEVDGKAGENADNFREEPKPFWEGHDLGTQRSQSRLALSFDD